MRLPPVAVFILGILGGVAEIVQEYALPISGTAHQITAFAIVVLLCFGVVPLGHEALARLIPAPVAAALTTAAGVLAAAQQTFGLSHIWHSVILVALAMLAAVGIVPPLVPPEHVRRLVKSGTISS